MKKFFTLIAAAALAFNAFADTMILSHPTGEQLNVLSGSQLGENVPEGWKLQCMNEAKNYGQGKAFTIDGQDYISIKLSNGAANTISLPEGFVATKITIYATINKDAATNRPCYWAEVGQNTYTLEDNKGIIESFKDYEHPSIQTFELNNLNSFTVKNTGEQPFAVFVVEYTAGSGSETPAEGTPFYLEASWPKDTLGSVNSVVDFDATAMKVSLKNFMGGDGEFVFDLKDRDPNAPAVTDKMYSLLPVSGVTTDGDVYGEPMYLIDGLKDKTVVFKNKGADAVKLQDIHVLFGTWSSASLDVKNSRYCVELFMAAKNSVWDAATSAWGELSANLVYFTLKFDIPYSGGTSAIENIGVDVDNSNAPVEYFNLNGVRISEPAAGQIVIRRQGTDVKKILVR